MDITSSVHSVSQARLVTPSNKLLRPNKSELQDDRVTQLKPDVNIRDDKNQTDRAQQQRVNNDEKQERLQQRREISQSQEQVAKEQKGEIKFQHHNIQFEAEQNNVSKKTQRTPDSADARVSHIGKQANQSYFEHTRIHAGHIVDEIV